MLIKHISINKIQYPLHVHPVWEILYYIEGEGYLATEKENIPFKKGTIILVPPNTPHGTVSQNGSVNISLGGKFNHLFIFNGFVSLSDNPSKDGETLIKLIFNNRYSTTNYLSNLCLAYIQFILQNSAPQTRVHRAVSEIIAQITEKFYDPRLELNDLLIRSGYAEDYIRSQFKTVTGTTPTRFLTKMRIDHAKKLFDTYGNGITVAEAAEACGFVDPIYFSKCFKSEVGVSPDTYRKTRKE